MCGAGCSQHQRGSDWKTHPCSRSWAAGAVLWSLERPCPSVLSLVVQTEVGVGAVGVVWVSLSEQTQTPELQALETAGLIWSSTGLMFSCLI